MVRKKKVMLIYPPGKSYQRGEERCQSNIEDSTSTTLRACNDLGYCAAELKAAGFKVMVKDYQNSDMRSFREDIMTFSPDVLFISTTSPTVKDDIDIINKVRTKNMVIILKGAVFFDASKDILKQLDLKNIDYLIGGESEFIIADLLRLHFAKKDVKDIPGIFYKKNGIMQKTGFDRWEDDLDTLHFPDRNEMDNQLYIRPDTGEMQATVTTSRGCPASCIYCLTPAISGKKIRKRSPENILKEMKECYFKHGIKNFFFRSDTFTMDKAWVHELCSLIISSGLHKKIEWVTNSRTKPIDLDTLRIMKKAGCWLVAFGIESGSEETLQRIRKGTTIKDNKRAIELAGKAGLKTYGFYMIGFPWESAKHLNNTKKLMFELDTDFVEMHIAIPYYGTQLYDIAKEYGVIDETVLGKDYFNSPTLGTKYLSMHYLMNYRKKTLMQYHTRPSYIRKRLKDIIRKPKIALGYTKHAFRLLRTCMKKQT